MIRNDASAASGSVLAMTSEVRTCSRTTQHAERRRDHRLDDRAGDRADRPLDQRRAVVERDDPHARRQAGLQLADLGLDPARDLERVLAVGHQDHAAGDLVAVLLEDAPAEARARSRPSATSASRTVPPPGRGTTTFSRSRTAPSGVERLVAGRRRGPEPADARARRTRRSPCGRRARRRARSTPRPPSTTSVERHAEEPQPVGVGRRPGTRSGTRRRSRPRPRPATEPSCGRTYQSWIARSRPRSSPPPRRCTRRSGRSPARPAPSSGVTPAGSSRPDAGQPLGRPAGAPRRARRRRRRSR